MKILRVLRTIGLVAGTVLCGVGLILLIAAAVAAGIGVDAYQAGSSDTSGWAKLAVIIALSAGGALLGGGAICLATTLVLHLVIRRLQRNSPDRAFPVIVKPDSSAGMRRG